MLGVKGDYVVLNTSFEGIGDVIFDSEEKFSQGFVEGYLLIFDHSEVKQWHSEWLAIQGKKIFAVWV